VQAYIIALRFGVINVGYRDELRYSTELDRHRPRFRARYRPRFEPLRDPADRFGESLRAYGFEHVVLGFDLEGIDRVFVVGRDIDDLGRVGELGKQPAKDETVNLRHPNVEEDRVDTPPFRERPFEATQGRRAAFCGVDVFDTRIRIEEVGEVVESWQLIVDREDTKTGHHSSYRHFLVKTKEAVIQKVGKSFSCMRRRRWLVTCGDSSEAGTSLLVSRAARIAKPLRWPTDGAILSSGRHTLVSCRTLVPITAELEGGFYVAEPDQDGPDVRALTLDECSRGQSSGRFVVEYRPT
jgi:hypothetical protein